MPMARRLAGRGFAVTAVDPSDEVRAVAERCGMRVLADVASAPVADAVLVLVATGDQLLDAVSTATTHRRVERETWILSSTVGPTAAQEAATLLARAVHLAAAAEALAVVTRLGLSPVATVAPISGGSGSSWFLDDRPRMADLGTTPPVRTRLAILAKDNELVEREADARGARVPLLKAARGQYVRATELGLLEADDSQIIRAYLD